MKVLALAVSTALLASAAEAHVVFNDMEAVAGDFHTAQLRVMHGCDGAPTTKVRIEMPDGVTRVTPRVVPGWTVDVEMKTLDEPILLHGFEVTETVGALTWSGGSFPDYAYEQFEFRVMMPEASGARLDFPVRQFCDEASLHWDDIAEDSEDPWTLEEPAPFIRLVAVEGR